MEYAKALIDKAADKCGGSYYKLAREWGVSDTMMSLIRKGERKLPIRRVPKLAEIAGVNGQEAMLKVAEEQAPEGSEERDLMGKVLAHGVAAMLLFFIGLGLLQPLTTYAKEMKKVNFLYIVEHLRRLLGQVRKVRTSQVRGTISSNVTSGRQVVQLL